MKRFLFAFAMAAAMFAAVACDNEENTVEQKHEAEIRQGEETSYSELVAQITALKSMIEALPESEEKEYYKGILEEMLSGLEDSVREYALNVAGDNGVDTKNYSIRTDTLIYWTKDSQGNDIQLSGFVHFPLYKSEASELKGMVINCHATKPQGISLESLIGGLGDLNINLNIDALVNGVYTLKQLTTDDLMVVEPDYEGFGLTASRPQTYLCHKLIARQCADMLVPAMDLAKTVTDSKGNHYTFSNNFCSYIVGYSQGGGQALALTRCLTEERPELMRQINLVNSVCGAGPYDPELTFKTWLERGEIGMSVLLPMVLNGYMVGHPDVMSGIDIKSYFSDTYNAAGIPEMVHTMTGGFLEGMSWDLENSKSENFGMVAHYVDMDLIMSDKAKDNNDPIMKALYQCLKDEQVCYDWTPVTPITLFSTEGDNIVPVTNTHAAYENLHAKAGNLITLMIATGSSDHVLGQLGYTHQVTNKKIYKGTNK